MKFYIASRLENADMVKRVAKVLQAAGHEWTYDWTDPCSVQKEGKVRLRQVAENERQGILDADILILILPGGRGAHAELGIALGAGKGHIIVCAKSDRAFQPDEKTCAFYWPYAVTCVAGRMDDWLKEIFSEAMAIDHPYGVCKAVEL